MSAEIPHVSTVHDLIGWFIRGNEYRIPFENAIKKSYRISAISNYVKDDIVKNLGVNPEKIIVIPNSIRYERKTEIPVKEISFPYVLNVNAFRKHKNTITLLDAFAKIKNQTVCNLVLCAGGGKDESNGNYEEIVSRISELGIENRVFIFYQVEEGKLEYLYNHAKLFVNPSTQEGFGRTPVEASLHKIPVLSTKETSLYEATLGMVQYIENPYDSGEIAQKILRILKDGANYDVDSVAEKFKDYYDPKKISQVYWNFFMDCIGSL